MYKATQYGWLIILLSVGLSLSFLIFYPTVTEKDPTAGAPIMIVCSSTFVLLLLFFRLQVTVTDTEIKLKFGIGIIQKKIPLESVKSVTKVKTKFWHGWGIRLTPQGWLWNISGYKAVELMFKGSEKPFRIGSADNEQLANEISKRL